jgi:WD40 repeat protein
MNVNIRNRFIALAVVAVLMFGVLFVQLFRLTIVEGDKHAAAAGALNERTITVPGARGSILDQSGLPLAYDQKSYNVQFYRDPKKNTAADDRLVAAGLWTGGIEILDAGTGVRAGMLPGHLRVVRGLAFNEDSRVLASVGSDGALHLWDVAGGLLLMTPAERDVGASHVIFLANGRVAVAWNDGRVVLVDSRYFDRHVRGNEMFQHVRLTR